MISTPKTKKQMPLLEYSTRDKWILSISLEALLIYITFSLIPSTILNSIAPYLLYIGIIFGGIPVIYDVLKKMWNGDWGADALAVIAIITAVYLGENVAALLIVIMLSGGQVLESYAMRRASLSLQLLAERLPSNVHKKTMDDKIEEVPLAHVNVDDLIVVYPHEVCPVDGIVVDGYGSMDESYLTGEPYEISKGPGASVLSGAINGDSLLVIKTRVLPKDSRYSKILKVMEMSEQQRPHIRRLADQLGAIFAPLALLIAVFVGYITGDSIRFLSVLVIATPCPLLIAIPIVVIGAISLAAKHGIIIKDPTVLERLSICKTAIFDKTGTLTYGKAQLQKITTLNDFVADKILQLTASLESYSKHPLAQAFLQAANERNISLLKVENLSELPGKGLSGTILGDKIQITGRQKWLIEHPEQKDLLPPTGPGLECLVVINGVLGAICIFKDSVRKRGKHFINHLAKVHGFERIMIISGDRSEEVGDLAREIGVREAYASQSPEEKFERVRKESQLAPTLFMGDGINDAPALSTATVGVAFGSGDIVAEAGGAVILESSLVKVEQLIHISLLMRKIALQCGLGGMLLSFIGMGFAAFGYISPVSGALIQEFIDIIAIVNALRLTWVQKIEIDFLSP